MKKYIGTKEVKESQVFHLGFVAFFGIIFSTAILLMTSFIVLVKLALFCLVFYAPIMFLHSLLYEVYVENDNIVVRNIFRTKVFEKQFLDDVTPTWIPLIFRIYLRGESPYSFPLPMINVFLVWFTNKYDKAEEMKEEILK